MADVIKCSVVDNFVQPCNGLDKLIEDGPSFGRWKGVRMMELTDIPTMKRSRSLVVAKSGDFKKTGIILNFCPFCGERIGPASAAEVMSNG